MKNILCFIYDGFVDYEISLTCAELNMDDRYNCTYVAYQKKPIKSSSGMRIHPDHTVSEALTLPHIEGLIIPGGEVRYLKPELEKLINQLDKEKKLIAAICGGPEFLAKVGLLKGRKYATSMYPNDYKQKDEIDPFPRDTYVDARMIRDNNIITAKGDAFIDFALEIWDWFDLYEDDTERVECKTLFSPSQ